MTSPLPIHFFTIVLNGEPFICHHIEVFRRLSVPWTWHIVEGLAAHNKDTAWGAKRGGSLPAEFLPTTRSTDGTSAYLDQLAQENPGQVRIYRKPLGVCWDGKLEMVNAPLANIPAEALLWQIDADELWTVEQVLKVHSLFEKQPTRTAAWFHCHFFVHPEYCTSALDVYGNFTRVEWLRVWRFQPGDYWAAHEPPTLVRPTRAGTPQDVGRIAPLTQTETAELGLKFQHFAYATQQQVRFKEQYYGYPGAVRAWEQLHQEAPRGPRLRRYLPWVYGAEIGTAHTFRTFWRWLNSPWRAASRALPARRQGIIPLAQPDASGQWRFHTAAPPAGTAPHIVLLRTDRIGDHLLFFGLIPPLRAAFPHARITLACPRDVTALLPCRELLNAVVEFDRERGHAEKNYQRQIAAIIQRVPVDMLLCPQYTRDNLANKLCSLISTECRIGFASESNSDRPSHVRKHQKNARQFHKLVPVSHREVSELEKYRQLLRALDIPHPMAPPSFQPSEADMAQAEALLREEGLADRPLLALFPGSAHPLRKVTQAGTALRDLPQLAEFGLIGLGDASHYLLIESALKDAGLPGANLAGRTTLPVAAALLKRCCLAVGADTGIGHLACAVGLPNVIVLGGGDFGRFFPYSPLTSAVVLPLSCYYCHYSCRYPTPYCLSSIPVSTLRAAIAQALTSVHTRPQLFVPRAHQFQVQNGPKAVGAKDFDQGVSGVAWDLHEV